MHFNALKGPLKKYKKLSEEAVWNAREKRIRREEKRREEEEEREEEEREEEEKQKTDDDDDDDETHRPLIDAKNGERTVVHARGRTLPRVARTRRSQGRRRWINLRARQSWGNGDPPRSKQPGRQRWVSRSRACLKRLLLIMKNREPSQK